MILTILLCAVVLFTVLYSASLARAAAIGDEAMRFHRKDSCLNVGVVCRTNQPDGAGCTSQPLGGYPVLKQRPVKPLTEVSPSGQKQSSRQHSGNYEVTNTGIDPARSNDGSKNPAGGLVLGSDLRGPGGGRFPTVVSLDGGTHFRVRNLAGTPDTRIDDRTADKPSGYEYRPHGGSRKESASQSFVSLLLLSKSLRRI